MKMNKWFKEKYEKFKDDPVYITEGIVLELNEKIVLRMKELNINRTELAKRLGVQKPFVTKLLNGNHNLTVKTMASIAQALEGELVLDISPPGFERFECLKGPERRVLYHKTTLKQKLNENDYKKIEKPELGEEADERDARAA
jgi:transcriptional regulator with XRE-family HTH domain